MIDSLKLFRKLHNVLHVYICLNGGIQSSNMENGCHPNLAFTGIYRIWAESSGVYTLRTEEYYIDGSLTGIQRDWTQAGALDAEEYSVAGIRVGVRKRWYHDRQMRAEEYYIKDKLHGVQKYYKSGNAVEILYDMGVQIANDR